MTLYQAIDEENLYLASFHHAQQTAYTAQDLTRWDEDNCYQADELELQVV